MIYILFLVLIQDILLSHVVVLNVRPLMVPSACVAIGMLEGGPVGAIFGMFLGFFSDMIFPENTVLFTVVFAILGFFAGFAEKFFINKKFLSYMFACLIALLITAMFEILGPLLQGKNFGSLLGIGGLQTLWSLPFAALVYPLTQWVDRKIAKAIKRRENRDTE